MISLIHKTTYPFMVDNLKLVQGGLLSNRGSKYVGRLANNKF